MNLRPGAGTDFCTIVADQDAAVLSRLCQILTARGHLVSTYRSGREALAHCERGRSALALIGTSLTDMSGAELSRQIRELETARSGIYLLGVSNAGPEAVATALAAGADDVFEQPIDEHRLAIRLTVAEHRLARLGLRARQAALVATISHESRMPMQGVVGMVDALLMTRLDAEQQDHARTMRASAEGLVALAGDLLDSSKLKASRLALEHRPFDFPAAIEAAVMLFSPNIAARGLKLNCTIRADVPQIIRGDPTRFQQLVSNLVSNAVKFTSTGEIGVSVQVLETTTTGATVLLAVRDTGIGIAPSAVGHLFEPYHQADGSIAHRYGGTGRGLAICKRVVEAMKGTIGVDSTLGEGSTFWVRLPVEVAPSRAPRATSVHTPAAVAAIAVPHPSTRLVRRSYLGDLGASKEGAPQSNAPNLGPRVLVVDDNEVSLRVLCERLRNLGVEPTSASSGAEALQLHTGHPYDLILMDCQMLVMSGFQTTAAIRAAEAPGIRIPIIAVAANAMPGDRERCLAAGMDDFATMPLRGHDLRRLVAQWSASGPSLPPPTTVAVGPSSGVEPSIDHGNLEALRELLHGDDDSDLHALIDEYLRDARTTCASAAKAILDRDATCLAEIAHRLKGSSATFGAPRLRALSLSLERLGREGRVDTGEPVLADMIREIESVEKALTPYRSSAPS